MKKYASTILITVALVLSHPLIAQGGEDFLRSTGKIYVVVGVILSMFIGIIWYMVYLDRKLTKLENQIKEDE
ncbi:MAG: CcmD family protein [Bacteroidota bacterium]